MSQKKTINQTETDHLVEQNVVTKPEFDSSIEKPNFVGKEYVTKNGDLNNMSSTKQLNSKSDSSLVTTPESENTNNSVDSINRSQPIVIDSKSIEQSDVEVPKAGTEFVAKFLLPILKTNPRISGVKLYQKLNNWDQKTPIQDADLQVRFANNNKTKSESKVDSSNKPKK